jgi:molybdopterin-synthase adenylyltransferase
MSEIIISTPALTSLIAQLRDEVERGAALLLNHDAISDRYLVHEVIIAGPEDCIRATESEITFAPQFLTAVTRRACDSGRSLGILHSHPSGFDRFSLTDDKTEAGLADFMRSRMGEHACFSLILCDGVLRARRFGEGALVPIREVGSEVTLRAEWTEAEALANRFDRQVRAFGVDGQVVLRRLSVAIIGLGGTGSVVAQQLAYLGVGRFVLIDGDTVEDTNLNRVVGSSEGSVGALKVDVAAEMIHRVNADTTVERHAGTVVSNAAARLLRKVDCIFICTDSHSSRAFLSELSYQYLVPAFDIGVSINAKEGQVQAITGRTQMLAPGLPCLWCSHAIDAGRIREEFMTSEERAADPYFNEGGAKQPAVVSINSTMVSMAVTMFLGAFTSIPAHARWQSYDALTGRIRLLAARHDEGCAVCGPTGVTAAGASRNLPFLQPEGE